ncbi:MAG TPA: hypothetical protein VFP05_13855 [Thermomicrobiales bacterium]|nr:hypothetical protein [Thermomicrobiales bacterium]
MSTPSTIFRQEALHYRLNNPQRGRAEMTLPRWMTRRVTLALWGLLVLIGVAAAIACFAEVPVSESGLAVGAGSTDPGGAAEVAVLFPAHAADGLRPGQTARISPGTGQTETDGSIVSVGRQPLDADAVEQLGLPQTVLSLLEGPVVLVQVRVESADAGMLAPGVVAQAKLPAGSRRAGSFLPLVGRFFGGEA